MGDFSNLISDQFKTIDFVNRVRIKFGILDKDKSTIQTIQVFHLDGSTSEQEMSLSDIMYLTEHGTINLPPKKVLRRIFEKINYEIGEKVEDIIFNVINNGWKEMEVRNEFILYNERINHILIPTAIDETIASDNVISGLLSQEKSQNYVFDLQKLKKFLKSEIFFTN